MNTDRLWQDIKGSYLGKIEAHLARTDASTARSMLDDVDAHLEQCYSELAIHERTAERFKEIIHDMGPAEDYVNLLLDKAPAPSQQKRSSWGFPVLVAGILVLAVAGFLLVPEVKTCFEMRGMTADELSHRAWQEWRGSRYEEAASFFAMALDKDDGLAPAWNGLGWSLYHLGRFEPAREALERCVKINGQFTGAWNGLGYIALVQDDVDRAITCWKKALAIDPSATAARDGLDKAMKLKQDGFEKEESQ